MTIPATESLEAVAPRISMSKTLVNPEHTSAVTHLRQYSNNKETPRPVMGSLSRVAARTGLPRVDTTSLTTARRNNTKKFKRQANRMPRGYNPLPPFDGTSNIQEHHVEPKQEQERSRSQSPKSSYTIKSDPSIFSIPDLVPPLEPKLRFEPCDALVNVRPYGSPRFILAKPITHMLPGGKIMTLLPGHRVKLVKLRSGSDCKIVVLWERKTAVEIVVWRDFLSEEPIWASWGWRLEIWGVERLGEVRDWLWKRKVV